MNLPPQARSRAALGLTASAALGRFELQQCERCSAVQYPAREACVRCLGGPLKWKPQSPQGELISQTLVHHSVNTYFRAHTPWRLGMVRLDAGITVIAHLHAACSPAPSRVRLEARLDRAGQGVLVAFPAQEDPNMAEDPNVQEMSCSPKGRTALITDGTSRTGQALVQLLLDSGAKCVWAGSPSLATTGASQSGSVTSNAGSRKEPTTFSDAGAQRIPGEGAPLATDPRLQWIPLDVAQASSVDALAGIGSQADIVINNAELHSTTLAGEALARAEMEAHYFGLLRLAETLGLTMRARAQSSADPTQHASSNAKGRVPSSRPVAWVNVLSIFALSNFPPHGTYSASKAAARSFSQCLRAEMQPHGIRVIDVFPGPEIAPESLARAIVQALEKGLEDVYPGDIAQDFLARWRENPKVLEREIALRD